MDDDDALEWVMRYSGGLVEKWKQIMEIMHIMDVCMEGRQKSAQ